MKSGTVAVAGSSSALGRAVEFVRENPGKVALGVLATGAVAATGGAAAVALAPKIGALVSAAGFGVGGGTLSGAAASSAGLAALGGGSVASGGLGVAGGTAVCAAGGAAASTGVTGAAAYGVKKLSEDA